MSGAWMPKHILMGDSHINDDPMYDGPVDGGLVDDGLMGGAFLLRALHTPK
jgi:hypothetical protein